MGLTLIEMPDTKRIERGALREKEAARYVNLSVIRFRELVHSGAIVARRHPGRMRRIYLVADLDRYLEALPAAEAS